MKHFLFVLDIFLFTMGTDTDSNKETITTKTSSEDAQGRSAELLSSTQILTEQKQNSDNNEQQQSKKKKKSHGNRKEQHKRRRERRRQQRVNNHNNNRNPTDRNIVRIDNDNNEPNREQDREEPIQVWSCLFLDKQ